MPETAPCLVSRSKSVTLDRSVMPRTPAAAAASDVSSRFNETTPSERDRAMERAMGGGDGRRGPRDDGREADLKCTCVYASRRRGEKALGRQIGAGL